MQYFEGMALLVTDKLRITQALIHAHAYSCALNTIGNMRHKQAQMGANTRNRIAYRHTQLLNGDTHIRENTLTLKQIRSICMCERVSFCRNLGHVKFAKTERKRP